MAAWENHVWSYDFVMDRGHDGGAIEIITVIDEYNRECLAILVEQWIRSDDVLDCLTEYLHLKESSFRFNHRDQNLYVILLKAIGKKPFN